jgi:CheY-like chemotaxis protein
MIRILVFEDDECLWNVVRECLESEGYTVIEACNDYEGLTQEHARLVVALPPKDTPYLLASD